MILVTNDGRRKYKKIEAPKHNIKCEKNLEKKLYLRHSTFQLTRGCLDFKKCSLITHHSSLKYHHSSLITHYSITHHLSLKIPKLLKVACLALVSNFDYSKNFTFCGIHGLT